MLLQRTMLSISEDNSPVKPVVRVEQGMYCDLHFFDVCPDIFHRGHEGDRLDRPLNAPLAWHVKHVRLCRMASCRSERSFDPAEATLLLVFF